MCKCTTLFYVFFNWRNRLRVSLCTYEVHLHLRFIKQRRLFLQSGVVGDVYLLLVFRQHVQPCTTSVPRGKAGAFTHDHAEHWRRAAR